MLPCCSLSIYCYYDDVVSSASFSLFIILGCLRFSSCLAVPLWSMRFHNIHRRIHGPYGPVSIPLGQSQCVWVSVNCARFLISISFHAIAISRVGPTCVPGVIVYGGWQPKAMRTLLQTADSSWAPHFMGPQCGHSTQFKLARGICVLTFGHTLNIRIVEFCHRAHCTRALAFAFHFFFSLRFSFSKPIISFLLVLCTRLVHAWMRILQWAKTNEKKTEIKMDSMRNRHRPTNYSTDMRDQYVRMQIKQTWTIVVFVFACA